LATVKARRKAWVGRILDVQATAPDGVDQGTARSLTATVLSLRETARRNAGRPFNAPSGRAQSVHQGRKVSLRGDPSVAARQRRTSRDGLHRRQESPQLPTELRSLAVFVQEKRHGLMYSSDVPTFAPNLNSAPLARFSSEF
jgi:hypothetical protein